MQKTIDEAIRQLEAGTLDFPGYVALLTTVGVNCYRVELKDLSVVYYAGMKNLARKLTFEGVDIAPRFNENILKEAITSVQNKRIAYPEFLKRIASAGIEGYEVDFKDKKITYRGRRKFYVQPFPPVK